MITGKGYKYINIFRYNYFLSQEVREGRTGYDSRFVYSGNILKSKWMGNTHWIKQQFVNCYVVN